MSLSTVEQIQELTKRATNILILLPSDPTTDAIASGLALFSVLGKMKKNSKVVSNGFRLPPNHQFLPKSSEIEHDLAALRRFIIKLDVARTKVEEMSYNLADDTLNIYVTPKNGFFNAKDVSTSDGQFTYDLIFVLDSTDLESLGKLYDDNTEFFYHTPVINIDHKASNEQFGQVNHVEVTATSTSEIVFELIRKFGETYLDEYMATSLLAGIISKTKSFQAPTVTPKSLSVASYLIESGARRDEIVKHLYQTKSIGTLKLWGRALARLKTDLDNKLIWTVLNAEDFKLAESSEEQLDGVIDELMVNMPQAKIVAVLYEDRDKPRTIRAIVRVPGAVEALKAFRRFKPTGSDDLVRFSIDNTSLSEAEKVVLTEARLHIS